MPEATNVQIRRLNESLAQLRSFGARGVTANDAEFKAWTDRTHRILSDIFGVSQYLRQFAGLQFCEPRVRVVRGGGRTEASWLPMDQDRFDSDSAVAELLLSDAIEDVSPEPSAASRGLPGPLSSISALLHPTISEIAHNRFEAGEYADAAEAAFKAVNVRVKKAYTAAGKEEKDGKPLMLSALSVGQPVIRLGDLSTESGKNVQEGYMHIFAGAIQAIRNPKAHENLSISRERAAQFLVLASLLMSKLDEAGCA